MEKFYIYDNDNRIAVKETLTQEIKEGYVVVNSIAGRIVQLKSYQHCLDNYEKKNIWLGFIDMDEFIVPKS